jgi:hypothetical protein
MTAPLAIPKLSVGIRPVPPKGNANSAWAQHFIQNLAPPGMAIPQCGIANGPAVVASPNQSGD